jgi:hypothetical protein
MNGAVHRSRIAKESIPLFRIARESIPMMFGSSLRWCSGGDGALLVFWWAGIIS